MGLREDLQTNIAAAFDGKLADAVKALTVIDISSSDYDPDTGDVLPVETPYVTRGVVEPYSETEIASSGGAITEDDYRVLLLKNEVDIAVTADMIVSIDSKERRIKNIKEDPAGATYELRIRGS